MINKPAVLHARYLGGTRTVSNRTVTRTWPSSRRSLEVSLAEGWSIIGANRCG